MILTAFQVDLSSGGVALRQCGFRVTKGTDTIYAGVRVYQPTRSDPVRVELIVTLNDQPPSFIPANSEAIDGTNDLVLTVTNTTASLTFGSTTTPDQTLSGDISMCRIELRGDAKDSIQATPYVDMIRAEW